MKKLFAVLAIFSTLIACNDNSIAPNLANLNGEGSIIGVWEYETYEQLTDTTYVETYRKVDKIATDKAGITFKNNGGFLSKQNAGWCGTPPISYAEYDGTFKIEDGNVIDINTKYWGGKASYKIEVINLTNNQLTINTFDHDYEQPY